MTDKILKDEFKKSVVSEKPNNKGTIPVLTLSGPQPPID